MLAELEPLDERGEEQRRVEAGVPAAWSPAPQRTLGAPPLERATLRDERRADRGPALGMRVEQEARPPGSRLGSRDEVGCRRGLVADDGLLLRGEGGLRARVKTSVDDDREPA